LSIELAEFLVDGDFLAGWSEAAGYIPPRPSALAIWQNHGLQSLLNEVSLQSQSYPDNEILLILTPALKNAVVEVLQQKGDPINIAQAAANQINQE